MMTLKEFLLVNRAKFRVGIRNNNAFQRMIETEFWGDDHGFNELKLRDYLYDYVLCIKQDPGTNYLLVFVLHEDEGKDEGKEKEE